MERLHAYRPLFCPWPQCPEHLRREPGFRFYRMGHYGTLRGRQVPRFRCLRCRRTFSRQSFAVSYYLKRRELLVLVAAGIVAGSAHRQIARSVGCAPSTVTRLSARLGRHAMALLARALRELRGSLREPLAADHFETFELSQDFPFGVLTAVGRSRGLSMGSTPRSTRAQAGGPPPSSAVSAHGRCERGEAGTRARFVGCSTSLLPWFPMGGGSRLCATAWTPTAALLRLTPGAGSFASSATRTRSAAPGDHRARGRRSAEMRRCSPSIICTG